MCEYSVIPLSEVLDYYKKTKIEFLVVYGVAHTSPCNCVKKAVIKAITPNVEPSKTPEPSKIPELPEPAEELPKVAELPKLPKTVIPQPALKQLPKITKKFSFRYVDGKPIECMKPDSSESMKSLESPDDSSEFINIPVPDESESSDISLDIPVQLSIPIKKRIGRQIINDDEPTPKRTKQTFEKAAKQGYVYISDHPTTKEYTMPSKRIKITNDYEIIKYLAYNAKTGNEERKPVDSLRQIIDAAYPGKYKHDFTTTNIGKRKTPDSHLIAFRYSDSEFPLKYYGKPTIGIVDDDGTDKIGNLPNCQMTFAYDYSRSKFILSDAEIIKKIRPLIGK